MNDTLASKVGVVIIGRNEGDRLKTCIESVIEAVHLVVYVDSGSSDGSVKLAKGLELEVVELDMAIPFTAARARNTGYERLLDLNPDLTYIQFVDGDCEVDPNWIGQAYDFLEKNKKVAAVCGRRRERYPDNSVYNMLCDIEWNTPVGETLSCGGDALMRKEAYAEVGGFRIDLIAGEEPELCLRMRKKGWKIWRLDHEMTLHDANMTRFHQWWSRSTRCGFTYAQGVQELGKECHKERNRALVWGALIPVVIVLSIAAWGNIGLILMLVYPLQIARVAVNTRLNFPRNVLHGLFLTIGKFPEMLGILKYYVNHFFGIKNRLIEYK